MDQGDEFLEKGTQIAGGSMARILDAERRTLEKHRPRLLKTAKGRFVLVHGAKVIDKFATERDALREGYRRFGPNGVFLVDEVGSDEHPRVVTFLLDHRD